MAILRSLTLCLDVRGELTETDPVTGETVAVIYQGTSPELCNAVTLSGRPIQRRRVVPRINTTTPARLASRDLLRQAVAAWRALDTAERAIIFAAALGSRQSAYHWFLSRHMRGLSTP
jgi:hypothetical protein